MNRLITKNPFKLALLALLINIIIGLIAYFISVVVLNLTDSFLGYSSVISLLILGQMYAQKYKEIPSDDIVVKTNMFFIIYQFLLGLVVYGNVLKEEVTKDNIIILLIATIIFILFCFLFFKWSFKFGARKYLEALKKKEEKSIK